MAMADPRELLPAARARAVAGTPTDLDLPDLRRRARRYERRRAAVTAGALLLPLLVVVPLFVSPLLESARPAGEQREVAVQPEADATPPTPQSAEPPPAQRPGPEPVAATASPSAQLPSPSSSASSPPPAPASSAPISPPPTVVTAPQVQASPNPEPHHLWIEVEDGLLTSPMLRHPDGDRVAGASGGAYVMVEDGLTDGTDIARPGAVDLDITVPRAGRYVIWARVQAPDHASNSFLVSMDGEEAVYWWLPPLASPEWRWLPVTDRGSSTPKQYALAAGTHRLRIANREDGVALDQILVTGATDDLPAGLGPTP